jgi:hypothetical protein
MAGQTGLLLVVNATETAGNVVVVDKVEYLSFNYDDAVLTETDTAGIINQNAVNRQQGAMLDKWTVEWRVVVADFTAYRGKSATTLAGDVKTAVNAVTNPDAI